jgi:hypothetical protein
MVPPSLPTFSLEGGLFDLPLRATSSPATQWHAETCHEPVRGPSDFPHVPYGEQPDYPSLRASDEHSFIVRVLRARRMVWLFPSLLYSNNLFTPALIWSSPSRKSVSSTLALACTTTRLALT